MSLASSLKHVPARKILAAAAALGALAACDKSDSTGPAASSDIITVSSPRAGSTWKVGDSLEVTWTVKEDPAKVVDAVDIFLSPDGGTNWIALNPTGSIPPASAKWGDFKFALMDSIYSPDLNAKLELKGRKTCRVKVEQYSTQDPELTVTTGDFTINP
jgi:hypothetical protein